MAAAPNLVLMALLYRLLRIPADVVDAAKKKVVFVEMFAGSCTMSKVARTLGCSATLSFDALHESPADVKCDIRDKLHMTALKAFVIKWMKQGCLVIGHQSPPCNQVSRAATRKGTRDLAKTATYLITSADMMAPFAAWTVENPESEYGLFRMVDNSVLTATKKWFNARKNALGQTVEWPSDSQIKRIRELLRLQVGVFYCAFGSNHPKPTRIGVNSKALKSDLLKSSNGVFKVSYNEVFRPTDCPHASSGRTGHACNRVTPDASIPNNLAKTLVESMMRVAEANRSVVVGLLRTMEAMSLDQLNHRYAKHMSKVIAYLPDAGVSLGIFGMKVDAETEPTPEPALEIMTPPLLASVPTYPIKPHEDQHMYEVYDRIVMPLNLLRSPGVSAWWFSDDDKEGTIMTTNELIGAFEGCYFHVGTDSYGGLLTSIAITHRVDVDRDHVTFIGMPCGMMSAYDTVNSASKKMAMVYVPGERVIAVRVPKHDIPEAKRTSIGEECYFLGCRSRTFEACGLKVTSCDDPIPEYAVCALNIPQAISVDADVMRDMRAATRFDA